MEVKPGYLQTDVGVTPEDWDIIPLGDIIEYVKGYAFQPVDYRPSGIRIIRVSDTTFDSVRNDNEIFIDSDKAKSYVRWALKKNDLVLSTVGSKPPMYDSIVGRVVIIDSRSEGALLNQNAVLLRSKDKKSVTQTFLLNHFKTKRYSQFIESIFRGNANQASITLKDLFKFKLAIPKKTQEISSIATALSDADAHISSLEQVIAKKRDLKQAAMQELLTGKKRLLGFGKGQGYKFTEMGLIPSDWEIKSFEEIMTGFTSGQTPSRSKSEYFKGNIPWITSGELNHNVIADTIEKITEEAVQNTNLQIIPKGTFLFAITGLEAEGTRGSCAITGIDAATNQSCMAVFPTDALTTEYLFYFYEKFGNWLAFKFCQGTKQQSYSGTIARKLPIIYPPDIEEQHAIATVLTDMDAELAALEQQRDKTRAIKQGMMQELLTGRIRLT